MASAGPVAADHTNMNGSGTENDPYVVENVTNLQNISHDKSAYYVLGNDIDASATETWNGGSGFDPVGGFNNEFTGTLDGQGFEIKDLHINRSGDMRVGLFGRLQGTVKNVRLRRPEINGGTSRVAALAAELDKDGPATVHNVSVIGGNVTSSSSPVYAGGLVGIAQKNTIVRDVRVSINVTADADDVGGLAGLWAGATGNTTFATGNVTGTDGTSDEGGWAGGNNTMANASYWDKTSSGTTQSTSAALPSANGLTTSEMQGSSAETNMPEFDFTNVWTTKSGDYPELQVFQDRANFSVTIDSTNSPVDEGDTLNVDATITNDGEASDTQTITLDVGGSQRDSQSVTLNSGNSQSITLSWTTSDGDAGDYTATVASDNDTDSTSVSVHENANFSVAIDSTNSPVDEGDTLNVDATITNDGDKSGTQTITLDVGGTQRDSQSVSLAAGNSQAITLSWTTGDGDAGDYTATVASDNDTDSTSVSVHENANFSVTIDSTNSPVDEGETLDVDATITNDGDKSGTQTITLDVGGTQRDSQSVSLNAGNSQSITLSWATSDGDAGDYTATVSSDNDTDSTGVSVEENANFSVTIDSTNSPVTEDETLDVDATITNDGDKSGTQTITLDVGGTQRDSQSVTLDPGNSQAITLSWATTDGDAGSYTATVSSENDTASQGVTVESRADFAVTIDSTNSPVLEGETLDVDATISNDGDQSGTQTITLDVGGTRRDSQSVSLDPGKSQSITLQWTTGDGDAGDYTATVSSDNDTDTRSVTVEELANFTVAIDGTNSPVTEGESLDVDATITNDGDRSGTQTITLDVGGSQRDSTSVSLDPGKRTSITLSWTTTGGDAGDYTAAVSSDNDTDSTSVTVHAPANFSVAIDGTNSPVAEGKTLDVDVTVTNEAGASGTQTITLDVDGTREDSESVTLGGSATETITLEWQTGSGDEGSHTATVESENDTASVTVEVKNITASVSGSWPSGSGEGDVEAEVIVESNETGAGVTFDEVTESRTITVEDVPTVTGPGVPAADGSGAAPPITLERLSFTVNAVPGGELWIVVTEVSPGAALVELGDLPAAHRPFTAETGSVALAEVSVEHDLPSGGVDDATFEFAVRTNYLEAKDVAVDDLALYRDESAGWNELPLSHVGANATHQFFDGHSPGFSEFVLGADKPIFEVSDARLTDETVTVGADATVTATVSNVGAVAGEYEVILHARDEPVARKSVTVDARATEMVTFAYRPAEPGHRELVVGEETVHLRVQAAPSDESAEPATATPDDDAEPEDGGDGGGGIPWLVVGGVAAAVVAVALAVVVGRRRLAG